MNLITAILNYLIRFGVATVTELRYYLNFQATPRQISAHLRTLRRIGYVDYAPQQREWRLLVPV